MEIRFMEIRFMVVQKIMEDFVMIMDYLVMKAHFIDLFTEIYIRGEYLFHLVKEYSQYYFHLSEKEEMSSHR